MYHSGRDGVWHTTESVEEVIACLGLGRLTVRDMRRGLGGDLSSYARSCRSFIRSAAKDDGGGWAFSLADFREGHSRGFQATGLSDWRGRYWWLWARHVKDGADVCLVGAHGLRWRWPSLVATSPFPSRMGDVGVACTTTV